MVQSILLNVNALAGIAKPARASVSISIDTLMNTEGLRPKRPVGPFGAKPARASAFIGVSILMDTEALAGFVMPAWASAFDRFWCSILPKNY